MQSDVHVVHIYIIYSVRCFFYLEIYDVEYKWRHVTNRLHWWRFYVTSARFANEHYLCQTCTSDFAQCCEIKQTFPNRHTLTLNVWVCTVSAEGSWNICMCTVWCLWQQKTGQIVVWNVFRGEPALHGHAYSCVCHVMLPYAQWGDTASHCHLLLGW